MIKANEIRVGNWLEWNKKPFKVCAIFRNVTENELWAKDNNELHPIPLTEEILLKCKFEKEIKLYKQTYMSYQFNGYRIIKNNDSTFSLLIVGSSCVLSKIKYLHKLQNIIFDLENIELEINL